MPQARTRLEQLQVRKLLSCVFKEDKKQIEKLIEFGIPNLLNYIEESEDGQGVLHTAAANNNDAIITYLIKLGASPEVQDGQGRTPAMIAAQYGHVNTLDILLETSRNLKLKDTKGRGILFYCLNNTQRHTQCAELCIEKGADCNNADNNGVPVLVQACYTAADNEATCLKLIHGGANPDSTFEAKLETALHAAAASGSAQVCRALIEAGANINALDKKRIHAYHRAAKNGHVAVLRVLAAHRAKIDVADVLSNTAMHYAAMNGHELCVRFLGTRGCPAKSKNSEGSIPRQVAKDEGHKAAMKDCRKAERIEGKQKVEEWALNIYDWVCEFEQELLGYFQDADEEEKGTLNQDQFVDILEQHGPKFGSRDDYINIYKMHDKDNKGVIKYEEFLSGKKYIHKTYVASAFEKKDKKKKGKKGKGGKGKKKGKFKLAFPICTAPEGPRMPHGAPPVNFIPKMLPLTDWSKFSRDNAPKNAIMDDCIWYMTDPGKTFQGINDATRTSDFESLKYAIDILNIPPDTRDKYYKTPLMTACAQGHIDMVQFLLDKGAEVTTKDNFFWTPLHFACHSGQLPIVQMLIDSGADMNAVTMHGATPIMRAIEASRAEVVEYLLEKGVKLSLENAKEHTALDVAMLWGDPRVANLLMDKFEKMGLLGDKDDKKGKGKKDKKGAKKGKKGGKAGGKKKGKKKGKQGKKGKGEEEEIEEPESIFDKYQQESVIRTATAIASGVPEHAQNIAYVPKKTWINMPSSQDLLKERDALRKQWGAGKDFPKTFKKPFGENVQKKVDEMGGLE